MLQSRAASIAKSLSGDAASAAELLASVTRLGNFPDECNGGFSPITVSYCIYWNAQSDHHFDEKLRVDDSTYISTRTHGDERRAAALLGLQESFDRGSLTLGELERKATAFRVQCNRLERHRRDWQIRDLVTLRERADEEEWEIKEYCVKTVQRRITEMVERLEWRITHYAMHPPATRVT